LLQTLTFVTSFYYIYQVLKAADGNHPQQTRARLSPLAERGMRVTFARFNTRLYGDYRRFLLSPANNKHNNNNNSNNNFNGYADQRSSQVTQAAAAAAGGG
jgi:hypothetical protein